MEPYWPGLFAKALEGVNVKDLITKIGSGVGSAPAGGGEFNSESKLVLILSSVHPPN